MTPIEAVIVEAVLSKIDRQRNLSFLWPIPSSAGFTFNVSLGYEGMTIVLPEPVMTGDPRGTQNALDSLLREIDALSIHQGGEHAPAVNAVQQAKDLIRNARTLIRSVPPRGELDFYYGELGIEWRNGNRILRLTCFGEPGLVPRLDYGTLSVTTPGEYASDPAASAQILATRLDWLSSPDAQIQLA